MSDAQFTPKDTHSALVKSVREKSWKHFLDSWDGVGCTFSRGYVEKLLYPKFCPLCGEGAYICLGTSCMGPRRKVMGSSAVLHPPNFSIPGLPLSKLGKSKNLKRTREKAKEKAKEKAEKAKVNAKERAAREARVHNSRCERRSMVVAAKEKAKEKAVSRQQGDIFGTRHAAKRAKSKVATTKVLDFVTFLIIVNLSACLKEGTNRMREF